MADLHTVETRPWTPDEVEYLRTHFPTREPVVAIAAHVRHSPRAVRHRARLLKLRRPPRERLSRRVRCACKCGQIINLSERSTRDGNLRHHFVNQQHRAHRLRSQKYPDNAPRGSLKREILEAMRLELLERGSREVERLTDLPFNTANYYASGKWKYLTEKVVANWRRLIPTVLGPTDPRLSPLLDTKEVRDEMGRRVGAAHVKRWRQPRVRNAHIRTLRAQRLGKPNPQVSAAKRAEWDTASSERKSEFLAFVKRRRRSPSEQIERAWDRWEARCMRERRNPTDEDAEECARRQASDLGLTREIVRLYVDRKRGVLDRHGPLPDIDSLVVIRDLGPELASVRLGFDVETLEREYRRNRIHLVPQLRRHTENGGYPWTSEEDAFLRAHPSLTDLALVQHVRRSVAGIRWRRHILGLRRRTPPV